MHDSTKIYANNAPKPGCYTGKLVAGTKIIFLAKIKGIRIQGVMVCTYHDASYAGN